MSARRRRVAVVSPYFPYPLSHGGAVRIFHLLREMAETFDIFLFAFLDQETQEDFAPVLEHCARLILVKKARYREPRWSTLRPPEAHEFRSPAMLAALARVQKEYAIDAVQVEYTMLAPYAGDVLVEHDVTFDLYRQMGGRIVGAPLGSLAVAQVRDRVAGAVSEGGRDVGARREAAGPSQCSGDSERRRSGTVCARD